MKKNVLLTLIISTIIPYTLMAQNVNKIGISASIQSNQFGITVPFWVSNNIVIAPSIGVLAAQNIGTDIAFAIAPRYYLKTQKFDPYIGIRAGTYFNSPSSKNTVDTKSKIDFIFGFSVGGEYFLDENFSLGVEAQGNITKSSQYSNRFGNPDGMNFNTATMINATFYFGRNKKN